MIFIPVIIDERKDSSSCDFISFDWTRKKDGFLKINVYEGKHISIDVISALAGRTYPQLPRNTTTRNTQCINAYAWEGEVVGCRLRCTLLQIYCVLSADDGEHKKELSDKASG